MIVGRDPDQLDEAGVCRAAIESCAENFSDGVVAPGVLAGAAGTTGLDRLQGHQYSRFHDRASQLALRVLWLGGCTGWMISSI
jgi:adenosylcobinamide-phosphate synthase